MLPNPNDTAVCDGAWGALDGAPKAGGADGVDPNAKGFAVSFFTSVAGAGVDPKENGLVVSFFDAVAGAGVDPNVNGAAGAGVALASAGLAEPNVKPGVPDDAPGAGSFFFSDTDGVAPNVKVEVPDEDGWVTAGVAAAVPKANTLLEDDDKVLSSFLSAAGVLLAALNENPDPPGAAVPLPVGIGNDGLDPAAPNENIAFLLDGSASVPPSSFFSSAGGAPNENPGIDAPNLLPLSFFSDAGCGGATPNWNPPADELLALVLDGSSFVSSPTDDEPPAPKLNPTDGALLSSSRLRLGLAGVCFPALTNENPPLPMALPPLVFVDFGGGDVAVVAAAAPKENPPLPMLAVVALPPFSPSLLSSSSSPRPRFGLAGVAPPILVLVFEKVRRALLAAEAIALD